MTMTHDAETVERVAKAMWDVSDKRSYWEHAEPHIREIYRNRASAALSALPPQEVSVADAARVLMKEHGRCTAIRPNDRTYLEKMAANIGRNRLRALSEKPHE